MTTLFGNVSKDHTVASKGSHGWTLDTVDNHVGSYEITFDRPFDEMPSAIVSSSEGTGTAVATVQYLSKKKMIIQTYYPDLLDANGTPLPSDEKKQNASFCFIAMARELPTQVE